MFGLVWVGWLFCLYWRGVLGQVVGFCQVCCQFFGVLVYYVCWVVVFGLLGFVQWIDVDGVEICFVVELCYEGDSFVVFCCGEGMLVWGFCWCVVGCDFGCEDVVECFCDF